MRLLFTRFWPLVRGRGRLALAGLLLVVAAAAETAAIALFGVITDRSLLRGDLAAFWTPAAGWLALAAAGAAASFGGQYLQAQVSQRFLLRLRDDLVAHLQRQSPAFFTHRSAGDLVARSTGDVAAVDELVGSGIVTALSALVRTVFFAAAVVWLRWDLAAVAFVAAPAFALAARRYARSTGTAAQAERAANGDLAAAVEENIAAMTLVQTAGAELRERARLHRTGVAWARASLAEVRSGAAHGAVSAVIETACMLLVVGLGTWEISAGRLSVGGLLAFVTYLAYLYGPVQELGGLALTVTSARAAGDRLTEVLDSPPAVTDRPGAIRPTRTRGAMTFERVSFRYPGARTPALDDVSFALAPGRLTVVTGASGSGKSTLAALLLRLHDPGAGRVLLDGRDLRSLELAAVRSLVSYVPQETVLVDGTIRDNIAYGVPHATGAQVRAAARAAALDTTVARLPAGYETPVGRGGRGLSGGQRQRVAIARALLRDTPVLVLDEPTASLDGVAAAEIVAPLRALARGRTTLLVTHDLRLAAGADHVVVLERGRVAEQGHPADLAERGGVYARLAGAAFTGRWQVRERPLTVARTTVVA